jgi:hypothetical protein
MHLTGIDAQHAAYARHGVPVLPLARFVVHGAQGERIACDFWSSLVEPEECPHAAVRCAAGSFDQVQLQNWMLRAICQPTELAPHRYRRPADLLKLPDAVR